MVVVVVVVCVKMMGMERAAAVAVAAVVVAVFAETAVMAVVVNYSQPLRCVGLNSHSETPDQNTTFSFCVGCSQ